jgi:hypothetical protein
MNQEQFVSKLANIRPNATFMSLRGYRSQSSEIADYSIVFHISWKNALKRSIATLKKFKPSSDLELIAKKELIENYRFALKKMSISEKIDNNFRTFTDSSGSPVKGVKLHISTNTLHLYGLVFNKRVLMPGIYPSSERRPLTIAKDKLRSLTACGKFRQFKITPSQIECVNVEHLSLVSPTLNY